MPSPSRVDAADDSGRGFPSPSPSRARRRRRARRRWRSGSRAAGSRTIAACPGGRAGGVRPATPSATSTVPLAERAAERVGDVITPNVAPGLIAQAVADVAAASDRAGAARAFPPFAFEASTPADAQTKPCRVSAMISGGRTRMTRVALSENHLHVARVAITSVSSCARRRGLDPVEPDDAALRLRDHLLGDDEHVGVLEPAGPRPPLARPDEIVAFLDLRDALERDDPDAHARPVTRRPAWAL